jgi:hypothetical protein
MLTGNLCTMGLPEILQWISSGRKTGTLELQHESIRKRILFRDGNIHSSWSNDPRESLGQYLVRSRRITEEQLFKALLRQESQGRLLGTIPTLLVIITLAFVVMQSMGLSVWALLIGAIARVRSTQVVISVALVLGLVGAFISAVVMALQFMLAGPYFLRERAFWVSAAAMVTNFPSAPMS